MRMRDRAAMMVFVCGALLSADPAFAQFAQQGPKLVGTGAAGNAQQGESVALSADGNTAIVGGYGDNDYAGGAWVWARSGGVWTQQGNKLVGSGAELFAMQGDSVAISADGNTAITGGQQDDGVGAVWVWTRSGGVWTQQGNKLVGSGAAGASSQGWSVALSADGNTAIVGGINDNYENGGPGAAWIWTRSGGVWTQQGNKLVGSGASGNASQGASVAISADGNTAIVGGRHDNDDVGAAWIWVRNGGVWTQQGNKLVGSGAVYGVTGVLQGYSVALSGDGNTAIVGGVRDNYGAGAAWIWTRSGGVWTQQGNKLVAAGGASHGWSVSLSADSNTAVVGGAHDSNNIGGAWIWTRNGGVWTQQGDKLVGAGAVGGASQGAAVSLSADARTALVGGPADDGNAGAAWVFAVPSPDLTIAKTHAGNFRQGETGTYTIVVTNSGSAPTAGTVTVTDTLPAGLTPATPDGVVGEWSCSIAGQTLTCTRSDVLASGGSYPPISLTVSVANNAPSSVTNTATASGGGETNAANDTASDVTTIDAALLPAPPTGLTAAAVSSTRVDLAWTAAARATSYQIDRKAAGGGFSQIGTSATTSFADLGASADSAYLYRVRAVNASGVSSSSAAGLVTTVIFVDSPLNAGSFVKAVHLLQLRTAVNALRLLAGLAPADFTGAATAGTEIHSVHAAELRSALDAARAALGLSTGGYTNAALPGIIIKAVHFRELREKVVSGTVVPPALSITTTSLPSATVGTAYGKTVNASGGQAPYTWSMSSGPPPGLAIDAASGSIFGTPTVAGSFDFLVTVRDDSQPQQTDSQGLSIDVASESTSDPGTFTLSGATPGCSGSNPRITLNWTAAGGATTYDVYRNGLPYAQGLQAGTQSFLDTSVSPGTSYTYFIRARNDSGSTDSGSLQATAPANCGGTQPGAFTLSNPTPGCNGSSPRITLNWTAASGVTTYDVYRDGLLYAQGIQAGTLTFPDTGVSPGTGYSYFIRARNASGSTDSGSLPATAPTNCGGTQPGSFTLSNATPGCNGSSPRITLNWTASSGVTTYDVYRDGVIHTPGIPAGTQSTFDTSVSPGTTYTYFIRARNSAGTRDSGSLSAQAPTNCGDCLMGSTLLQDYDPRLMCGGSGTVTSTLKNVNGSNSQGSLTRHLLYTAPIRAIDGSNPATFTGVPAGSYLLEGYHDETFWGEEFWTSDTRTVTAGQPTNVTLTRNYPYASAVAIKNHATGAVLSAGQTVPLGTMLRAEVTVRNDIIGTSKSATVRFLFDRSQSASYDSDQTATAQTVAGSGGTRLYTFTYQPTATGSYKYSLAVHTTILGNAVLTDSWTWTQGVTVSTAACEQEATTMAQEYGAYGYNELRPACSDFTTSGGSAHFTWSELNGGWSNGNPHPSWGMVKPQLTAGLEATRAIYNRGGILLTSGYRCPHGNASPSVGGEINSSHTHGTAADMYSSDHGRTTWTETEFTLLKNAALSTGKTTYLSEWDTYAPTCPRASSGGACDRHLHATFKP